MHHDVREPGGDVAEPALPPAERVVQVEGRGHLDLAARSDTAFVDEARLDEAAQRRRHPDERFVFGKCLPGHERTRQVEVAARPRGVRAESADVGDEGLDLVVVERVTEGGHLPRERADRPAGVDDGLPVHVRLRGREAALCEVGERRVEADLLAREAPAIGPVAGRARRVVEVAPALLRLERWRQDDQQDEEVSERRARRPAVRRRASLA